MHRNVNKETKTRKVVLAIESCIGVSEYRGRISKATAWSSEATAWSNSFTFSFTVYNLTLRKVIFLFYGQIRFASALSRAVPLPADRTEVKRFAKFRA
jgi:hypothetical protein